MTDSKDSENEVLTLREVAHILKCCTNQVYELTRGRSQARMNDPLPVFTIHRKMKRVRRADLMRWLDEMVRSQRAEYGETSQQRESRQKRELRDRGIERQ